MTLPGDGWRRNFGIVVLWIQITTMVLSMYIIHTRSHIPPLNVRSKVISYMFALSTTPMLLTPIIDIVGESVIPCRVYYWVMAVSSAAFGTVVLQFWRVIRMYGYEQLKKEYKYGKVRLSDQQSNTLKQYQRWHSDTYIMIAQITNLAVSACIYTPIYVTDPYYNSNNTGCHVQQPPFWSDTTNQSVHILDSLFIAWFITLGLTGIPLTYLSYKLYNATKHGFRENVGLVSELYIATTLVVVCCFLFVLITWFQYTDYMTQFNYFYLCGVQPTLFCILFIIYPSLHNTTRARKIRYWYRRNILGRTIVQTDLTDDITELYSILKSQLGFGYMLLQAKSEFSEETLQCLKAIWQYKEKPNYPKMMQLHNQFIEEYSPFQVNISANNRYKLSKLILSIRPECSVIEIEKIYDSVEKELINLLINNSYVRFKRSDLYQSYINNKPLPTDMDTDGTTVDATIAKTNTNELNPSQHSRGTTNKPYKLSPAPSSDVAFTTHTRHDSLQKFDPIDTETDAEMQRLMNPGLKQQIIEFETLRLMQPGIKRETYATTHTDTISRTSQLMTARISYGSTLLPNQIDMVRTTVQRSTPQSRSKTLTSKEFDTKQTYVAPRMKLSVHKPDTHSEYRINVAG